MIKIKYLFKGMCVVLIEILLYLICFFLRRKAEREEFL